MKKLIIALCILILAVGSLFAEQFNINSFYGEAFAGRKYTAQEKAEIQKAAKENNCKVTFGADDSMTVVDNETKEKVVISGDHMSLTVYDGSGRVVGSINAKGGAIESNEFTKQVPDPKSYGFTVMASASEDDSFVMMLDGSLDSAKKYIAALKQKGFTVDADEQSQELKEYNMYFLVYEASNKAGYSVTFGYTDMAGQKNVVLEVTKH